ncbi:MAG: hypothetical protein IJZ79_02465 [Bacilli bacterium]|nr:hypothetical protein [Bacilli bacterium]
MKRFLVVGLMMLTILSLTACNKEEDPTSTAEPNYAINETKDTTEEDTTEENIEPSTTIESTTEEIVEEEIIIPEAKDQIYNVKPDQYAQDVRDMSTISIDGKLIGFPCTYKYVTEVFGQLNTVEYAKYGSIYTPVDETITSTSFEVYATPVTGAGQIRFTFRSADDTPVTITEMSCAEIMVQGGNTTGEEVMTFALPQSITFGSTLDDLLDVYGVSNATHSESDNNAADYRIRFVFEDLHQCYEFTGYDNGLFIAKINYNYTE